MSDSLLVVDNVEVSFGGFRAVDKFSMAVRRGELRVLIGANGAGKTTLMDVIGGKTKATGGAVVLNGQNITNWSEARISRAGIGRKFQIPSVFKDLTVEQNLEVAFCKQRSVLHNIWVTVGRRRNDAIETVIELVGLQSERRNRAGILSHGQTQWLELGMVLVQNPDVILLDEPTAGMTGHETTKTASIINRLKGTHTLLVVEHDMHFVRSISETITVMHLGKKLAEGRAEQIEHDPAVIEAYLGSGGISGA